MTQTLRDFINAREAQVKASIKALNDELRELQTAKSAITGEPGPAKRSRTSNRMTHRDMFIKVLEDRRDGGTTEDIAGWVAEKFNVEIPQPSMSSQLSRAKSDKLLTLDTSSKRWRLAKFSTNAKADPSIDISDLCSTPSTENPESADSGEANIEEATNFFDVHNPNLDPGGQ
tara:strand:+ start:156 stop:674 length:519 start_codon:yes stop_codon:yes gene_type:complete